VEEAVRSSSGGLSKVLFVFVCSLMHSSAYSIADAGSSSTAWGTSLSYSEFVILNKQNFWDRSDLAPLIYSVGVHMSMRDSYSHSFIVL
jgi:hypothetical protein